MKVAVIKSKVENFDEKEKSDDYINARYDGIIETDVKPKEKQKSKLDSKLGDVDQSRKDGEEKTAEQIRADSMKADEEAWKKPLSSSTRKGGSE